MKILITGLPKTGTTGLFYLIANSFKEEPKLLFEPDEWPIEILADKNSDVIAKMLVRNLENVNPDPFIKKIIILIRDPRDRMVSALLYSQYHANYLDNEESVNLVREYLEKKENRTSSVSFRKLLSVIGRVNGRKDFVSSFPLGVIKGDGLLNKYIVNTPDSIIYKYEDFVCEEYSKLEEYLGISILGSTQMPDQLARVKRTGAFGDWRNWFTDQDVEVFKPIFSPWLEKYGYDADDWTCNSSPFIESEHCSKYFMRLVEERRNLNKIYGELKK